MVAVDEIGAPVMHGAISTFLMVLITAFAKTYVFKVFFRLFTGIIVFGVLHGVVLLPAILSLKKKEKVSDKVNPYERDEAEKNTKHEDSHKTLRPEDDAELKLKEYSEPEWLHDLSSIY